MAKILVTGGAGYIGSHAVKKLLQEGFEVVVLDNFSRGWRKPLEILKKYGKLFVVEGDIIQLEDLRQLFRKHKIDVVMHFAASCLVSESMDKPDFYFRNNSFGTLNLLQAMREAQVDKMIFSSTCAVYGNAKYLPIDENHPTSPENPYGESKIMAEKIIEWFGKLHNIHYVIFRYFNVCGADLNGEIGDSKKPSELLVQNAVRSALGIEQFRLTCPKVSTPDGTPIRDYIDVEDVVKAHLKALEYMNRGGDSAVLNIGNGTGWSVKEIIEAVKRVTGKEFDVIADSLPRKGEYEEVYASSEKTKDLLGWSSKKSLNESINSLVLWYQSHPNGYEK